MRYFGESPKRRRQWAKLQRQWAAQQRDFRELNWNEPEQRPAEALKPPLPPAHRQDRVRLTHRGKQTTTEYP
jgi:hypothetical protein